MYISRYILDMRLDLDFYIWILYVGGGRHFFKFIIHTMCYISLEESFQALFRMVFRLKIFPLEAVFLAEEKRIKY